MPQKVAPAAAQPSTGPLSGVTVLDLTSVLMGPFATQQMGDMGADVIKVEMPEGDVLRGNLPARHAGMPGQFLNLNRNKRGIVLDLKRPAARRAFLRLVRQADVVVHNLRPQAVERLELGYQALRVENPRLIYCAARGYRADGPYGRRAAYDDLIQAGSGLCSLIERTTGQPAYVPTALCDKIAGLTIVYAVAAALFARERSGCGEEIEVPMLEVNTAFNLAEHIAGFAFEPPLGPLGYARMLSMYRRPYRTADGWLALTPYSDRDWRRFFAFAGRPELAEDPRFRDIGARVQNIDALYAFVEEVARRHGTAEWMAFCEEASIPAMPVRALEELWDDPHLQATGFFGTAEHPSEGGYRTIGFPVRFASQTHTLRRHAPRLGEHGREVLAEAGLSADEIEAALSAAAPLAVGGTGS